MHTTRRQSGRPQAIDDDHLFNQFNGLLGFLDQHWGDLGWGLQTARSSQQLRTVFNSVDIPPYLERLLAPFVRPTLSRSTAAVIREARRTLRDANSRESALEKKIRPEADRVRETAELLKRGVSAENLQGIEEAHRARLDVYAVLRSQIEEVSVEQQRLRSTLLEDEAALAQRELLTFIHARKYAHNPRNVAGAMAGLPDIGSTMSLRRCAKHRSYLWPSARHEAFKVIAECVQTSESKEQLLATLERTIVSMRSRDRRRADVKNLLSENWRYLRKAVEVTDEPVSVKRSYVIFSKFTQAPYQPRSEEERVLADRERLVQRLTRRDGH